MTDINDMLKQLDSYRREHGIDICVIDDSGFVGTAAAITHAGEIYMDSAESMVNNVLKERGPYMIRRLDILDHGNEHSFSLGSDWIDNESLPKYEPLLSKLRPAFGPSGFVHLQHCHIGMNKQLLIDLAKIWDVAVYAGTGYHNPVYRVNYGHYVRADPNGSYHPCGRPNEDTYQTYWGMHEGDYDNLSSPEETSIRSSSVAHETAPPKPKLIRAKRR